MWTAPIDIFQKKLKNIDIDIFEIFFVMKIAIYIYPTSNLKTFLKSVDILKNANISTISSYSDIDISQNFLTYIGIVISRTFFYNSDIDIFWNFVSGVDINIL